LNKYSRPSAFLVIAFLVATLSSSRAGDQSADAAALLANARKLEDLQSEPLAPFVVKAQLSAAFAKGTVEGEYAVTWWDRNRWNELLTLADFRRAREGVTGGYTQVRSLDYPRSELWQDGRDATPSEIAQQTPPRYPQESKERHEQGVVTVYARIEADGSVSHLKALQIPYPALAQATIDAVGRWKYKPRTCGGTPVREEKIIQVSYALGG
jgi:TonB family protein